MSATTAAAVLDRAGLDALVAALAADGFTVVGPTVRDGAIVLAELASAAELPYGWGTELRRPRPSTRRHGGPARGRGHLNEGVRP